MKLKVRLIIIFLVAALLLPIIAGCKENNGDDGDSKSSGHNPDDFAYNPDEFTYVPEFINVTIDTGDVMNVIYSNGKIYFSSREVTDPDNYVHTAKLYSMELDGTNITELTSYKPVLPVENSSGGTYIQAMTGDDKGNLWIIEFSRSFRYNLPADFDGEEWEKHEYLEELDFTLKMLKLDNTGAELLSADLRSFSDESYGFSYVSAFEADADGNIYILTQDFEGSYIRILDSNGNMHFRLEASGWNSGLVRLPDGSIAFTEAQDRPPYEQLLRIIDFAKKSWGESINIPFTNVSYIYPDGNVFDLLFNDGNSLYGFILETEEEIELLRWFDSYLSDSSPVSVRLLPDGRILCIEQTFNITSFVQEFRLIILTKTALSDLPDRIALTLAVFNLGTNQRLENAIRDFNRSNPRYIIKVTDYMDFSTTDDWKAGLTRLTTEIISGQILDILCLDMLPYKHYINRGLLEDLYPFIDSDPELGRNSLMEGALRAAEVNGGLYQAFSMFGINTIIGDPAVLGSGSGWTIDEFMNVIAENPEAVKPMGVVAKDWFAYDVIMANINEYIDWVSGTAHFDRGDFARLLEFADTLPAVYDYSLKEIELIASGEQIMLVQEQLSSFEYYKLYEALFGGNIVFKGFPTESRAGNYLHAHSGIAITSSCKDKNGAWQFVRMTLTEAWQNENIISYGFPSNKATFEARVAESMDPDYKSFWNMDGYEIEIKPTTQEQVDTILALIDSLSGAAVRDDELINIISEGLDNFFSGHNSAEDTARIIQSRVSIYLSEQS